MGEVALREMAGLPISLALRSEMVNYSSWGSSLFNADGCRYRVASCARCVFAEVSEGILKPQFFQGGLR